MTSDPGDYIGGGQTYFLTPQDGTITVTGSPTAGVTFAFNNLTSAWWGINFVPPAAGTIAPGMFDEATRYPFQSPTKPGLDATGMGRGCNRLAGRFVVLEAVFDPNGEVTSFAADFEQHCELMTPALFGSVRFNSSVGTGPRISVASAWNYEGDGEPKSLTFLVSLSARAAVPVSVDYATADDTAKAGTDYVATSGTLIFAAGQTVAAVNVPILGNKLPEADRKLVFSLTNPSGAPLAFGQATGTILDDDTGKTFIDFASDPGDYIGAGQTFTLTPLDGTITPSRLGDGVTVHFQGSTWWDLRFVPPAGGPLVPGIYDPAGQWPAQGPTRPGINVDGDGRGCSPTGRFVVLEARYAPAGDVQALAIDYEQHCDNGAAALIGSVRFNSLVERGPRLSVAPAAVFEGDGEPNVLAFRVSLSKRVATDVSVDFATSDGTAAAGTDYTATSGNLVIPAGQTGAQVNVPVLGNKVPQPDRSLVFSLSNAVGAPLAFGLAAGTIVDDDALRTFIRLDSEAGDYIGAGNHVTLRPPLDGVISTIGGPNDLEVLFRGLTWWDFHFTPPVGRTLTVGAYEGATRWPFQSPTVPGLDVSGDGRGCNTLTGRFDVLQADYGPTGAVQALAIDAEQHCEGMAPALFVSIRINSTIPVVKRPAPPTLAIAFGAADVPLGGSTSLTFKVANPNPQDVLTGIAVADALPPGLVVSTPNGLSGACGGGTIAASAGTVSISLTGATLFMNETCTFSVNVTGTSAGFKNDVATVTSAEGGPGKAAVASIRVGLPASFLFFASDPGDVVGQGQTFTLTAADGPLNATGSSAGGAFLHFNTPGYSTWWDFEFVPPSGAPFAPGAYEGATRWPFRSPTTPGLSVSGQRGCNSLTGRFVVLETQFGPAGEIQVLALDYEQHCNGVAPALFGSVRYNSALPVGPRISVAPAVTYEGDGEPKTLTFWVSLSARAPGSVKVAYATADDSATAGTDYVATSGTALFPPGQTVARVDVPVLGNTVPQPDRKLRLGLGNAVGAPVAFAEAFGRILDDDTARTFLDLASDPGDFAGGGQALTLTPLDGTFTSVSAPGYVGVTFQGSSYWFLSFAAPAGTPLAPGIYEGATRYPFQLPTAPGLSVYGGGCNMLTGRFVVLEADIGPGGDVRQLAIDFEQHCEGAEPALLGSIRINSLLSTAPRLSVAPATAYEGNGEPKSLAFRISLSRRSGAGVSFDYATVDGSAKAGTDYVATTGSASLASGQTSARVDVPILGNRTVQPNRTLSFKLDRVIGSHYGFGEAPGVIRDDDSVRTLLYLASEPGDPVGSGVTITLTDLDGVFTAAGLPQFDTLITFAGADSWSLRIAPPIGAILSSGAYEGAARFPLEVPPTPGLDVSGAGHFCSAVSGRFVVLEARFGTSGQIDALAIDFEQHCNGIAPALFGSVRYNSAVPVVPRAARAGLFTLPPCRVVDTRLTGSPLQPGADRFFATAGACGIPPTATALVGNLTVTGATQPGSLTVYRADSARPFTTSISFPSNRTRANNALIAVSSDGTGSIKVFADSTGTVDLILDVSGYFQ